jgi:hypothetical protein
MHALSSAVGQIVILASSANSAQDDGTRDTSGRVRRCQKRMRQSACRCEAGAATPTPPSRASAVHTCNNERSQVYQDSTSPLHVHCTCAHSPKSSYTCRRHAQQPLPSVSHRQDSTGCCKSLHQLHTYSTHPERVTATECMQQCNETVYMLDTKMNMHTKKLTQTSIH